MTALILKRANFSRPSGQWQDEDYDVLADAEVIGRDLLLHQTSRAVPRSGRVAKARPAAANRSARSLSKSKGTPVHRDRRTGSAAHGWDHCYFCNCTNYVG
jgi:hypothetical protein